VTTCRYSHPVAFDLDEAGPPLGVAVDVAEQIPNDLRRRVDERCQRHSDIGSILFRASPRDARWAVL